MIEWLRRKFAGASEYIGSVLVAVLLVPIVPDVAVELFGSDTQRWLNPVLRAGALLAVIALVLLRFRARERARIRAARGARMVGPGPADVLALPLSPERKNPDKPTYTTPNDRKDHPTSAELLIDSVRPQKVFAVITPQFGTSDLDRLTTALGDDDITLIPIWIDDGNDPSVVVPQIAERLTTALPDGESLYIDVTGGTKAMSLGMARAASLIGARCLYVGSQFRAGGRLPGTQRPYAFDPRDMFSSTT